MEVNVWTVLALATVTALATGLGVAPFLVARKSAQRFLGVSNALAAGMMLAASFGLIYEQLHEAYFRVLAGALAGLVFVVVMRRMMTGLGDDWTVAGVKGSDARRIFLFLLVMTIHSFAEGVAVGVSFAGSDALGLFITAAIAVHNIPEGLSISLMMVPHGARIPSTALWCVFSSLPQPLMAVPAYLFVEAFADFLPVGLGFAAGAMIWMVAAELLHEALDADSNRNRLAIAVTVAIIGMTLLQVMLDIGAGNS